MTSAEIGLLLPFIKCLPITWRLCWHYRYINLSSIFCLRFIQAELELQWVHSTDQWFHVFGRKTRGTLKLRTFKSFLSRPTLTWASAAICLRKGQLAHKILSSVPWNPWAVMILHCLLQRMICYASKRCGYAQYWNLIYIDTWLWMRIRPNDQLCSVF